MRISDWSSDVCSSDLLHLRPARDDGLWSARRAARRAVPGAHPLQFAVAALSYRQRLDRGFHADDRLRDGRRDGQYLSGTLVCGRLRRDHRGRRHPLPARNLRSEEHTSELQSLMRISYAVFCLKKTKRNTKNKTIILNTHTKTINI